MGGAASDGPMLCGRATAAKNRHDASRDRQRRALQQGSPCDALAHHQQARGGGELGGGELGCERGRLEWESMFRAAGSAAVCSPSAA